MQCLRAKGPFPNVLPEAKYVFLCFIKAFIKMYCRINFTVREWSLFMERWLLNGRGRGGGGKKVWLSLWREIKLSL